MKSFLFFRAVATLLFMQIIGTSFAAETPVYTVQNKGVGGNTTRDALARYDADVSALTPKAVIVFFGMNDAVNDSKSVPLEEFRSNLQRIVQLNKKAAIKTALVTPNPVIEEPLYGRHPKNVESFYLARGGGNAIIREYNAAIREVAAKEGVALLDYYQTVSEKIRVSSTNSAVCSDGLHPSREGMNTIARMASEFVRKELPSGGVVVCFGDSITLKGYPEVLGGLLQKPLSNK